MQSYIQYINKNGTIKAVEVERQEVGQKVRYVLPTIQEQFFILTVFDNNKRVLGLGFVDVENLDMLAFLNSDFQSVDALPEIAFFNAYQEIILETDLVVLQNGNVVTVDNFPSIQNVTVDNTLNAAIVNFSDFPQTQFPSELDVYVRNFRDASIYVSCKNLTPVHFDRLSDAGNIPFFGLSVNTYSDDVIGMVLTQHSLHTNQDVAYDIYRPDVLFGVPFFYAGLWFKFHSAVPSTYHCTFDFKYFPNSNCFKLLKNYANEVGAPPIDLQPKFIKTATGFVFNDDFGAMSLTVQDVPFE